MLKAFAISFVFVSIAFNCCNCQTTTDFTLSVVFGNLQQFFGGFTNNGNGDCDTASKNETLDCIGGAAKMAALAKELKRNYTNTLFISEGGNFYDIREATQTKWWGNFWANDNYLDESRFVANITNQMGYDYVSLSDDDLDDLFSEKSKVMDLLGRTQSQQYIYGCDITINGGTNPTKQSTATTFMNRAKPSIDKDFGGVKVRIVSYTSGNGMHWVDNANVANNNEFNDNCKKLVNQTDAKIVIGVFESSFAKAEEIARNNNNNFTLIIVSGEANMNERSKKVGNTTIVYSKLFGRELQQVNITIKNNVVEANLNVTHKLDKSIKDDANIKNSINGFHTEWNNFYTTQKLGISYAKMDSSICATKECSIGNLLTDAIFHNYYNSTAKDDKTLPIVAVPAKDFWSPLNPADHKTGHEITVADLFFAIPYKVVTHTTLKGLQVRQLFENILFQYDSKTGNTNYLQVSGVKIEYNLHNDKCKRITKFSVKNCTAINCTSYEPLADDKNYIFMNYDNELIDNVNVKNECNFTRTSNTINISSDYFADLLKYTKFNGTALNVTTESRLTTNSANQLSALIPTFMFVLFSLYSAIV